MRTRLALAALALLVIAPAVFAQAPPRREDVASPAAIVEAAYDAIARRPGEPYDWDRFRSLFLPGARLVPNTEQTGGEFRVLTPEGFVEWVEGFGGVGGPDDKGFAEEQVAVEIERYGDVAHAFSTYQKHFWGEDEILGRGINSFQLVFHEGRWWIAGIAWDEENGAGPIPEAYRPTGATDSPAGGGDVSAAMEALYERFTAAYAATAPDDVVALYGEDALYLPAGGDVRRGTEALRDEFAFLEEIGARGGTPRIAFESLDRGASGDLAYDVGCYRLRVERADGTTTPASRGKFATIWKRGPDGRWRIHVDSFSPAPESEGAPGR